MFVAALPPPPLPPFMTMEDALIECQVNGDCDVVYNVVTVVQMISNEVFDNDLVSCMDKSNFDLDSDWKTYSQLTVAQG